MDLTKKFKIGNSKTLSNDELEAVLRGYLGPLIEFLEQSKNFDDGYPDQFPKNERIEGEQYHDYGLNIDHYGWTLKPMVDFSCCEEPSLGRKGHGRFLTVTAFGQEHVFNEGPGFGIDVVLYESGKIQFKDSSSMSGVDESISNDINPEQDILKAMGIIVSTYLMHTYRTEITNNYPAPEFEKSRAYERSLALAEGALLIHGGHFPEQQENNQAKDLLSNLLP